MIQYDYDSNNNPIYEGELLKDRRYGTDMYLIKKYVYDSSQNLEYITDPLIGKWSKRTSLSFVRPAN